MRTAAERDALVARVKEVHAAHPTFASWPEIEKAGDVETKAPVGPEAADYVTALYEICAEGVPTGRFNGKLTGKREPLT